MHHCGNFKIGKQIYFLRSYENREVLANLKTDLNKILPIAISEEIKHLTKYFGAFLSAFIVSFDLK